MASSGVPAGTAPLEPRDRRAARCCVREDLLVHLRQRLAPYKPPRSFELVDYPLRDDAGKVRRSEIRDQHVARLKHAMEDSFADTDARQVGAPATRSEQSLGEPIEP